MTKQDLFNDFGDVFFALAPSPREMDDQVSRQDVEDLRRKVVAICDRVAMQVEADTEFTAEDAADMVQQIDLDEASEVGRD
jgi:hypothetical protein